MTPQTREKALACIKCEKVLDNVYGDNQPIDGVALLAYGAYGSTVFDPMDGSAIEINVCDACLTKAGLKGMVLLYTPVNVDENRFSAEFWSPDKG